MGGISSMSEYLMHYTSHKRTFQVSFYPKIFNIFHESTGKWFITKVALSLVDSGNRSGLFFQ